MRSLLLPLLVLVGCGDDEELESTSPLSEAETPPIEGTKWVTGKHGITVYVPENLDDAALCVEVDAVTDRWITYWQAREPWHTSVLVSRARQVPLVLYPRVDILGRTGFYKYGSHAGVCLYGGFQDLHFNVYLLGIEAWFHEATHALKGEYHA